MLIRFSLCLLNKKCSNWLLSYNSKTLTFLIVLVLLAGVGKRAEPSTVWAWLGCYSRSQNHHWGSVGLGGRKRWTYTTSAPFCSIPSSGKLPASSTVDSVSLSMLPVPSHPSGEMQLQVVNTAKPSRILLNAAKPTEQCSSGAVDLGRALCFRSSVVQLGGFFHSCFLFS